MEKYFFDDNKYIMLIIIAIIFLVLFAVVITSLYQAICGDYKVILLFVLALCSTTLYFLLFFSILKEKYSSIEFDNQKKYLTLYAKYSEKLKVPYEQIKLIKFNVGACIRGIYFTKIEIFTDYARYKITLIKAIKRNDGLIKELLDLLKIEYHNTIILLP